MTGNNSDDFKFSFLKKKKYGLILEWHRLKAIQ